MCGYASREEQLAHNASEMWLDSSGRADFVATLTRTKTLANVEACYRRKDGSRLWVLESVSLLESENGAPPILEGTMIDITRRKEAEEEARRGKEAAERASLLQTDFLGRLVTVLDAMRTGDLSGRLNVDRGDEFGALATGFNRMTDELAGLVGQVQASGLQVNASVTEIAAPPGSSRRRPARSRPPRPQIGATSREISATSKKLVGTMNDVAAVAEQSAALAGLGQTGLTHMEETMRRVMDAAGVDQREARRPQRQGGEHQPGGHDDYQGRRPDQPAVAQRRDRSREGGRIRPRLCRRGDRDPPSRRPDRGGDLRHRPDGQGDPVGRGRRRDGHGQVLRGGAPRHGGGAAGRRPVVAGHPAGAGAGAAASSR